MLKVNRAWICLVLSLLALGVLYSLFCRPHIAGLYYDDGIYLQAARELAVGHGYHLASEPGHPAIVKYPPLFPFLLSIIWYVFPQFPANLPIIKGFNIVLTLLGLTVLYQFCKRTISTKHASWLAFGFVLYWGLCPSIVYNAVDVLSEPLYFLLSLSTIYLATCLSQKQEKTLSWRSFAILVLLSVMTFYTRTIGLSLILGFVIWLWCQYGQVWAFRYLGICIALLAPWFMWCYAQPNLVHTIGSFYSVPFNQTYWSEMKFILLQNGNNIFVVLGTAINEFAKAFIIAIFPVLNSIHMDTNLLFLLGIILLLGSSVYGIKSIKQSRFTLVYYYLAFYFFFCLIWPFTDQYLRFLAVVMPVFTWLCFVTAVEKYSLKRYTSITIAVALLIVGGLNFESEFKKRPMPIGDRLAINTKRPLWQEYQTFFKDLNYRLKPDDIVWGPYSAMYPLYVQRQVIAINVVTSPSIFVGRSAEEGKELMYSAIIESFRKNHITHVLLEPRMSLLLLTDLQDRPIKTLIDAFPQYFSLEYQSEHNLIQLYRFHG